MTSQAHAQRPSRGAAPQAGFTLIEVVVAMAILAMVILTFLGTRTDAMVDATEARNWRIAKELAEQLLSELEAGARENRPELGRQPIDGYEDFEYEIVVGETAIARFESSAMDSAPGGGDRSDRLSWQRERDELRMAQQNGLSLSDYRDQQLEEEIDLDKENRIPNEDDFEEVLVVVHFPEVRLDAEQLEAKYTLKARLPTLAIEGLTPEEAGTLAKAQGVEAPTTPAAGTPQ
jgi:prepilin-type N-terminal cleavage/methylation domain-containing protein